MDAACLPVPGTQDKVAFLRDELKVDYAFDYRDGKPLEHLKKGAPDGIQVYFDNTGGPQLEAALYVLNSYGRVALCGGIASYNTPAPGPRNLALAIGKRLRLEGFIVSDHMKERPAFLRGDTRTAIRRTEKPRNIREGTGCGACSSARSVAPRRRKHWKNDREAR